MKICPSCKQIYTDATLSFCLNDGTHLIDVKNNPDVSAETVVLNRPVQNSPNQQFGTPNQAQVSPFVQTQPTQTNKKSSVLPWVLGVLGGLALLCGGGLIGSLVYFRADNSEKPTISSTKPKASPSAESKSKDSNKTDSNLVNSANNSSPISNTNSAAPTKTTKADLTLDKYNRLKMGMTYSEVADIMGGSGVETSSSVIGGTKSGTYNWDGEKAWRISGLFRNDRLYSKSQSNYPKPAKTDLSLEKFNRIKVGMTYPEVAVVIGAEGMETRSSDIGTNKSATFEWQGEKVTNLTATFGNGKLERKSQYGLK